MTTSKRTFIPGAPHLIKMQIYVHLMYLSIFVKFCALEPIGCLTISSWWSNGRDKVPVTYSNVWCILVDNTCNILWQAVTLPNWSCSLTSTKMESPMRPPVTQIQMMKVLASMKTIFYDPLLVLCRLRLRALSRPSRAVGSWGHHKPSLRPVMAHGSGFKYQKPEAAAQANGFLWQCDIYISTN